MNSGATAPRFQSGVFIIMRHDRALTPTEKVDARAALAVLDGSGMTLEAAAIRAIGRRPIEVVDVDTAVDRFTKRCIRKNLSPVTVDDYSNKLNAFADQFEGEALEAIDRSRLNRWIEDLPIKETTRKSYRNVISVFLNWCQREDPPLVSSNVIEHHNYETPKVDRSIDILTADEAGKVLAAAGAYAPALALMMFAGTRPSEIHSSHKPPMQWKQVDTEGRIIRITSQQSKTRQARPMEGLPDNLWTWLVPGDSDDYIAPARIRQAVRIGKGAIGRWSQDICRHSFFTYHLAKYGEINRAMLIAGHENKPSTMYQHYRGVATKAEADKFFALSR